METSLAESQTDSYFPTKWPNGYPKQKDVSDTHIQRRTNLFQSGFTCRIAKQKITNIFFLVENGGKSSK